MTVSVYDNRVCQLGEGPLWHPVRQQLFWFDILGKKLMTIADGHAQHWQFGEHVSAAGWVDKDRLLIASESELFLFNLVSGDRQSVVSLEADNPVTRSNDGRADPWGGFWIGTMGKNSEQGAGAIYRYYRSELRKIIAPLTTPNSIAFAPDRPVAYFADTQDQQIMQQNLSKDDGWPVGEPEIFVDLSADNLYPDGSVVDREGCLWNAQWGASRIARYSPDGTFMSAISFPAQQTSCPAFGGDDLRSLYVTTAAVGLTGASEGHTFQCLTGVVGQAEHCVDLSD